MTELFEKSIRVLELPQLLERLSQKAVSEAAKERALRLTPSTDADDVRRLQDETDAARALIGLRGSPSFSGVKDVREALARAERGGMLNPRDGQQLAGIEHTAACGNTTRPTRARAPSSTGCSTRSTPIAF